MADKGRKSPERRVIETLVEGGIVGAAIGDGSTTITNRGGGGDFCVSDSSSAVAIIACAHQRVV